MTRELLCFGWAWQAWHTYYQVCNILLIWWLSFLRNKEMLCNIKLYMCIRIFVTLVQSAQSTDRFAIRSCFHISMQRSLKNSVIIAELTSHQIVSPCPSSSLPAANEDLWTWSRHWGWSRSIGDCIFGSCPWWWVTPLCQHLLYLSEKRWLISNDD